MVTDAGQLARSMHGARRSDNYIPITEKLAAVSKAINLMPSILHTFNPPYNALTTVFVLYHSICITSATTIPRATFSATPSLAARTTGGHRLHTLLPDLMRRGHRFRERATWCPAESTRTVSSAAATRSPRNSTSARRATFSTTRSTRPTVWSARSHFSMLRVDRRMPLTPTRRRRLPPAGMASAWISIPVTTRAAVTNSPPESRTVLLVAQTVPQPSSCVVSASMLSMATSALHRQAETSSGHVCCFLDPRITTAMARPIRLCLATIQSTARRNADTSSAPPATERELRPHVHCTRLPYSRTLVRS